MGPTRKPWSWPPNQGWDGPEHYLHHWQDLQVGWFSQPSLPIWTPKVPSLGLTTTQSILMHGPLQHAHNVLSLLQSQTGSTANPDLQLTTSSSNWGAHITTSCYALVNTPSHMPIIAPACNNSASMASSSTATPPLLHHQGIPQSPRPCMPPY